MWCRRLLEGAACLALSVAILSAVAASATGGSSAACAPEVDGSCAPEALPEALPAERNGDEASAMQVRSMKTAAPQLHLKAPKKSDGKAATAWVAGAWGACARGCPGGPKQGRSVECRALFSGELLSWQACGSQPRPSEGQPCSCEELPCADAEMQGHASRGPGAAAIVGVGCPDVGPPVPADPSDDYTLVGCFKWAGSGAGGEVPADTFDYACVGWQAAGPCHGGLPFYNLRSNAMTPPLCRAFCFSKGFDIFGLVHGPEGRAAECRCGASALNKVVWDLGAGAGAAAAAGLGFDPGALTREGTAGGCGLRAYRYTGHYEAGTLPAKLLALDSSDAAYVESVVTGRHLAPEEREEGDILEEEEEEQKPFVIDPNRPTWETRNCWPSTCAGGNPWPVRQAAPIFGDVPDVWQDYVLVPYIFAEGTDDGRKQAFREAARRWRAKTCINFKEFNPPIAPPYVRVGEFNSQSCSANLGYGGPNNIKQINLGWCRDSRHIGNMVHEIGHIVGMYHEQSRPDAQQEYFGRGPFLTLFWENIPDVWRRQWLPRDSAYMGSVSDGIGDPQVGYADYDYESILHYYLGRSGETVPPGNGGLTGQRRQLSDGDITQANDMYQCRRKSTSSYVRFVNRWTQGRLYSDSNGNVFVGDEDNESARAMWSKEVVGDYFRLRNRATNGALNVENGTVVGEVLDSWYSAQWSKERAGKPRFRLVNRLNGHKLHAERRPVVQASDAPNRWWSSQWIEEVVEVV